MNNIIKVFFGSIFPKIFVFGLNVVLARSLSLSEFGFYSYVKSFYNYFETTVSSALNPFAISRLLDGDFSKAQFLALYLTYGLVSSLLAMVMFWFSGSATDIALAIVLFGGILGAILNACFYVILINNQRGHVILLTTFLAAISLLCVVVVFPITTALFAIVIAFSFNIIDLGCKLIYFVRAKKISDIKASIDFKNIPLKPSFILMFALMINGGVFLFQRHLLSTEQDGFEQMGYLEVSMQLYALITIILTSLANGLMRERDLTIFGIRAKGMGVLAISCGVASLVYCVGVALFSSEISLLYQVEIPRKSVAALCLMIVSYAFAFFSVRLLIVKNMEKINFYSTLLASVLCCSVYLYLEISALAIVLSYCIFFIFLGLGNVLLPRMIQGRQA